MAAHTNGTFVAPSDNRIEVGSVNILPAELPKDKLPEDLDADKAASELIDALSKHFADKNFKAIADLFLEDGFWRDHLCLSWDMRTLRGREKIEKYLVLRGGELEAIALDRSTPARAPGVNQLDAYGESKCVAFFTTVTTKTGTGQGHVRLIHRDGGWKILTFYTGLRELKGFEEPRRTRRAKGGEHGGSRGMKNWQEKRSAEIAFEDREPAVLIIGAGQGGLTSAARLKMLNVDTLVIDRNERVGDNWRQRYRQLVLHDPVWFDHMPYISFPDHWPIFTPKDKLAEFFEAYVNLLELNIWCSTSFVSASWDGEKQRWNVVVERQIGDAKETRTIHPRHIIQATGHSGKKNFPTIKGMETFKGRLCHSSEFPGAQPNSQGKRAIVVGSCNSGHDIAQDYYENGYDVTMIQRSTTCVVSSEAITKIALGPLYAEEGTPEVEDADTILWSMPTPLSKTQQIQVTELANQMDKTTLEALERAGFRIDKGVDNAGLFFKYFQRGGGYYIDVGCSQLITEGKIKVKQGQELTEVQPDGILFADGTKLEADEVVFATGYQNMRTQARIMMGDEVADKLKDVWGFDEEGEWRTIWRQSGHPGYWFMGGNLALARYYGRYLALQIKGLEEGLTTYHTTSSA
ncbi:flavin-binding monooxygenase-like protein [Thozetella sp. PMI_491]|nr:flavin-binding monooxygenase-like protein [Thozetella sp. PMI_491]